MHIRTSLTYLAITACSLLLGLLSFEFFTRHQLKVEYTQERSNLMILYNRTLASGGVVEKLFGYEESLNPDGLFPKM